MQNFDETQRGYQPDFYNLSAGVRDRESRLRKADKIAHVIRELSNYSSGQRNCLDIGCSSGIITTHLASLFTMTLGIDFDPIAMDHLERAGTNPVYFLRGDAMHLPLSPESVDVVICAQVYEHVPSDEELMAEIFRILKPGGLVFFSGPNKLFPIEPHYFLPFLHWLPARLANHYLRLFKRGDYYYERSRTWWGLRQLTAQFIVKDVTIDLLQHNQHFIAPHPWGALMQRIPAFVWRLVLPLLPNFNWLLYKPEAS